VEHSAIIKILQAKGFNSKWIRWIEDILSTATTSILLNGVAGKEFKCRRGVRQGDPLSPLLFAIAADLLQCVVNDEYAQGHLIPPFSQSAEYPFPIIQYADDTILVMQGCESQLLHLKEILHRIAISTGLIVNYHKSCLLPINNESREGCSTCKCFWVPNWHFSFHLSWIANGAHQAPS